MLEAFTLIMTSSCPDKPGHVKKVKPIQVLSKRDFVIRKVPKASEHIRTVWVIRFFIAGNNSGYII